MEPQILAPSSQGLIPVEIVSYSDSDAPFISRGRALCDTQAAVESLAIKHFIQEFKSAILSSDVEITI